MSGADEEKMEIKEVTLGKYNFSLKTFKDMKLVFSNGMGFDKEGKIDIEEGSVLIKSPNF